MSAFRKSAVYGLALAIICCIFSSCMAKNEAVATAVEPSGWQTDNVKVIKYHNSDTVSLRDIRVFVMHNDVAISGINALPLTITTISPDSLILTEDWTFGMVHTENTKNNLNELSAVYRSRVVLQNEGEYIFNFKHNNNKPVEGIWSIGIEMVPSRNGKE